MLQSISSLPWITLSQKLCKTEMSSFVSSLTLYVRFCLFQSILLNYLFNQKLPWEIFLNLAFNLTQLLLSFIQFLLLQKLWNQRRPSSARGDSISELERFLEKPSVPLQAKGPPGPPRIVEIEEKYSAIEGEILVLILKYHLW